MNGAGWIVYIVENERGALYTGITTSLDRRLAQHAADRGARFFRLGRPRRLVYAEPAVDRRGALRREAQIKRLGRAAKLALIGTARAAVP